ncbi:MAG TPA: hypothetical protein VLR89_09690, partial [Anaerolineaceae bacterium]|nr:hypothetical protein [Anaerolineaceae bacterium]
MDKRVFLVNARFGRVVLGLVLIYILLFVMVFDAHAVITIRYAKQDGLITGECASWAEACTLQRALEVAVAEQEVWVARGLYYPGTDPATSFAM